MYNSLKTIHDFGDYDSATRLPNIDNKKTFDQYNYIPIEYYNDIAARLEKTSQSTDDTIYGSYFEDLKTSIENYKIPSTRYYKEPYECCDYCSRDCYSCNYCAHSCCIMCIDSFDNGCSSNQNNACGRVSGTC
jgi:hypothetical protein